MKRFSLSIEILFGDDEPEDETIEEEEPQRDSAVDTYIERNGTNEPDDRAQLDSRRRVGFGTWEPS